MFNVGGIVCKINKNKFKDFISSNSLEFLIIQKNKHSKGFSPFINFLSGNSFCEWSFLPTVACSGSILLMCYNDK